MIRKLTVLVAIVSMTFLVACSDGQVELPDPGNGDDDDPDDPLPSNPAFGMLVTNTSQTNHDGAVTFDIPWGGIDANPNSDGPYDVTTYMALVDNNDVIEDTSFVRNIGNDGQTEVYHFNVSENEYEPYCGDQVTLMAMINPQTSDLPPGNSLDSVNTIPEADVPLPEQYTSSYEQQVDIVCGAQEVSASLTTPSNVEDNGQFTADASGSEGPIESYSFSMTGQQGSISNVNGDTATVQAPNLNDDQPAAVVNLQVEVSNSEDSDTAVGSVIVSNDDYDPGIGGPRLE